MSSCLWRGHRQFWLNVIYVSFSPFLNPLQSFESANIQIYISQRFDSRSASRTNKQICNKAQDLKTHKEGCMTQIKPVQVAKHLIKPSYQRNQELSIGLLSGKQSEGHLLRCWTFETESTFYRRYVRCYRRCNFNQIVSVCKRNSIEYNSLCLA